MNTEELLGIGGSITAATVAATSAVASMLPDGKIKEATRKGFPVVIGITGGLVAHYALGFSAGGGLLFFASAASANAAYSAILKPIFKTTAK